VKPTPLPDRLVAEELHARLTRRHIPWTVQTHEETASTNDLLWQLSKQNAARHGTVVMAETQTAGRGRLGRLWQSRPNLGLWTSLYFQADWPMAWATRFTILAAAATARAIRETCALPVSIKWPNDITFQGRKLAGILTEASPRDGRLGCAIVGIGLNIHHATTDFEGDVSNTATSLDLATGQTWRRADIAVALLESFDTLWTRPFNEILDEWRSLCDTLGRRITVSGTQPPLEGHAEALDDEGQLLLRTADGRAILVGSGEISLLPAQSDLAQPSAIKEPQPI
jgi:BirA family biotin operon repressor/biotin-[acetyl-CoA-carboxylase] ligase